MNLPFSPIKPLFILCFSLTVRSIVIADTGVDSPSKTVHRAAYTSSPVVIDGRLDEAIWKKAQSFSFNIAWRKDAPRIPLSEGGVVKLAWDDDYLYIGALLHDADIIAENDSDNAHHYTTGDVLEIFLKPPEKSWYWEMYATPHSRRTVFFFPSRGRVFLPSSIDTNVDLKVSSKIDGTLNYWEDRDRHWTTEMAIPLSSIRGRGDRLAPDAPPWKILIARYNYSAYHQVSGGETSTTSPHVENANFHNSDAWGELILEN